MLECYTVRYPVAKKEHICDLCKAKIAPGEKYRRFSGVSDGDFFDVKHHLDCAEIINEYCERNNTQEYENNDVDFWVIDCICGDCPGVEGCEKNIFHCDKVKACLLRSKEEETND